MMSKKAKTSGEGAPMGENLSPGAPLGHDLIWGVAAIAAEIGRNQRQTFHLLEHGNIPAKKVGGRWCALRSTLRQFFEELAASAAA